MRERVSGNRGRHASQGGAVDGGGGLGRLTLAKEGGPTSTFSHRCKDTQTLICRAG